MNAKVIHETKHLLLLDRDGWDFVERKNGKEAVAVIAVTSDRRIVLTQQYRRPVDAHVIDYPAGLVGDEEGTNDPAETAKRELEEETGYACSSVRLLAKGPTSPGIVSEVVSFYRAEGVERRGAGGGVGGENITVHAVPLSEVREWLRGREKEGILIDMKVWGGLYLAEQR